MNGQNRKDIKPGLRVHITQKQDQRTGKTSSRNLPSTRVASRPGSEQAKGRVQEIVETGHMQVHDD
jgi:uncharacterized protein YwbE